MNNKSFMFLDIASSTILKNNYKIDTKETKNATISHFIIDDNNYKNFKKNKGDYYTIHLNDERYNKKYLIKEIERIIDRLLNKYNCFNKFLVVGLGNKNVISDSIGVKTCEKIIATNQYDFLSIPKVVVFVPDIINNTGISSFELIKMIVSSYKPKCIIIIDSMLTKHEYNLNKTIEITDCGIIPAQDLKFNKEISYSTFKIPVISIGIPLVIKKNSFLFSSVDVSMKVDEISSIIANSLNNIFLS